MRLVGEKGLDKLIAVICILISVVYLIAGGYLYVTGQLQFYWDIAKIIRIISAVSLSLFAFCGLAIFGTSYVAIRRYKRSIVKNSKVD